MKRKYESLSMELVQVRCAHGVLAGSLTTTPISVSNKVEVEEFTQGFSGDDYRTIGFE